jgi:hypothetical protein
MLLFVFRGGHGPGAEISRDNIVVTIYYKNQSSGLMDAATSQSIPPP